MKYGFAGDCGRENLRDERAGIEKSIYIEKAIDILTSVFPASGYQLLAKFQTAV
jgi:hypothetical protein